MYAKQQFTRTSQLTAAGFASHQELDKATAAVETANANLERAKELFEAARLGPTREERAVADATVDAAAAVVGVVAARVAKLRISAPSDGTVALLVAEPGEAIVPGQPVMTLQRSGERWASLNLREDRLGDLRIGFSVELNPANGTPPIEAKIDEIIPAANSRHGARPAGSAITTSIHSCSTRPDRTDVRRLAAGDVGVVASRNAWRFRRPSSRPPGV